MFNVSSEPSLAEDCDGCTCTDVMQQLHSNKKYKLAVFFAVAIVGLFLIFDNPGAYGG